MTAIEVEGGTTDEAIEKALAELELQRDQVDVEVLASRSDGLFGAESRSVRVRVTPRADHGASPLVSREAVSRETAAAAKCTAREVIQTIARYLGVSMEMREIPTDGTTTRMELSGPDSALLIGRHGQTLDAIEHLVNRIVWNADGESASWISLDVEGYRDRRHDSLVQLALRHAATVKASGRPVALEPMSPRDRRSVHLALQDDPHVTTRSEGEGRFRHTVIVLSQGADIPRRNR